ncbi:retrovirus-related pol polyprotein from transposon TNT 1-94 [Tanacetum coccineum]
MLQRRRIKLFTSKENTLFLPHKRHRHRISENQSCTAEGEEDILIMSVEEDVVSMGTKNMHDASKDTCKEHYGLMSSSKNNNSKVWHLRYGHLNVKGLQLLSSENMVNSLPAIQDLDHVYEGCALGMQTRKPFPVGQSERAKKKLELVPANIYGPMKAQSLTRTLECFKKFKALTEKQSGDSLKVLGTDSKEFCSLKFNDFGKA